MISRPSSHLKISRTMSLSHSWKSIQPLSSLKIFHRRRRRRGESKTFPNFEGTFSSHTGEKPLSVVPLQCVEKMDHQVLFSVKTSLQLSHRPAAEEQGRHLDNDGEDDNR